MKSAAEQIDIISSSLYERNALGTPLVVGLRSIVPEFVVQSLSPVELIVPDDGMRYVLDGDFPLRALSYFTNKKGHVNMVLALAETPLDIVALSINDDVLTALDKVCHSQQAGRFRMERACQRPQTRNYRHLRMTYSPH